jgi:hypothetical protein
VLPNNITVSAAETTPLAIDDALRTRYRELSQAPIPHILTQQPEASILAVSLPSGTQLIDLHIEHAVEGQCREE